MERRTIATLALWLTSAVVSAQAPPTAIAPPPIRSPEVAADRRVTFRIAAPNATAVAVAVEGSTRRPMQKGADGVWTLTRIRSIRFMAAVHR